MIAFIKQIIINHYYQFFSIYSYKCSPHRASATPKPKPSNGFTIDQLSGTRTAVANFEVRLPFTGPEKLSAVKSKFFFSELNLFFDAGLAWNAGNQVKFQIAPDRIGTDANGNGVYNANQRVPALSTGVSLRVNFFGYFVLEPYLAVPFNRNDVSKPVFGLGFTPGW